MRANFTQYDNDDLRQKDRDHNIHPWTDFATFKQEGSEVMAEGPRASTSTTPKASATWTASAGSGASTSATAGTRWRRRWPTRCAAFPTTQRLRT